jgi:hypothetical protein
MAEEAAEPPEIHITDVIEASRVGATIASTRLMLCRSRTQSDPEQGSRALKGAAGTAVFGT